MNNSVSMTKGQYFTVEQMLLFTIGIVITTAIYFSLITVNESVKNLSEEDQMYEIGKLVSSEINRVYNSPGTVEMWFDIPDKISGEGYRIFVETDGTDYNLSLKMSEKKISIPIESEYNASGMLFSSAGIVKIEKMGDKIIIGRL